jgi:hypothetical protein
VTCWVVHATNKMGSSWDDWIFTSWVTHSLLVTLTHRQYSAIADIHTFQFTVAHAIGFSPSTSRILATNFDTQTTTVSNSKCYTYIRYSIHTLNLHRATNFPLLLFTSLHFTLLHFTYNSHSQPRTLNSSLYWNLSFLATRSDLLQLRTFHRCLSPRTTRELL